jgi:hypothetical protein
MPSDRAASSYHLLDLNFNRLALFGFWLFAASLDFVSSVVTFEPVFMAPFHIVNNEIFPCAKRAWT